MAIQTIYQDKTSLTGGSATALDGIDGNSLVDGDRAYVLIPGTLTFYVYRLNATSGAAESSPNIIAPDTNPGDKRWILFSVMASITGLQQIVPNGNFTLRQNSVNVLTSEETGGIANTLYLKAGNVGIGTTAPTSNSNKTTLTLNNASWGGRYEMAVGGTVKSVWDWNTSAATNFGTVVAEPLYLQTNGATAMTILNGGNVGIGTTSPAARLAIQTEDAAGKQGLIVKGSSSSGSPIFEAKYSGGESIMVINPSGNVGIGTTGPGKKLHVLSTGYDALFESSSGGAGIQIKNNDTNGKTWGIADDAFAAGVLSIGNATDYSSDATKWLHLTTAGNVGIGTTGPNYQLELSTDSAGKPGVGGLWTVVSDERIKKDIELANLDRCYEIIKSIPLKRFGWADGVYTEDQVNDRYNLGWIAQDVKKAFSKAVSIKPFTKAEKIPDGQEEYEEQDFTIEEVEKEEVSIEIRDGKPVQIKKIVKTENKIVLFDSVEVVDEEGNVVLQASGEPLTHQVPRMIKKIRDKFRQEVIEDCLDLNSGQLIAALYGAVQHLMVMVEELNVAKNKGK